MATSRRAPSDQALILRALKQVDRRVRMNRILADVGAALCVLLAALSGLELTRRLVGRADVDPMVAVATWGVALVVFEAWRLVRRRDLALAAGVADRRGDLKDELKTAYWFLRRQGDDPWVELQVHRAAGTASQLHPKRIVPTVLPRSAGWALALAGLLAILMILPSGPPGFALGAGLGVPEGLTGEQQDQIGQIQDLIQQAEQLEQDDPAADESLSAEARERLEEALRRLEEGDIGMDEAMRELEDARNAMDEGNLETGSMQEGLEELAADLAGQEGLDELAQAMRDRQLEEAAELMRELAERLSELGTEELAERLEQASAMEQSGLEELLEALQQAAENLSAEEMEAAQQALQRAAEAMEAMGERMQAQELMNEAGEQMQGLQQSMAQQKAQQEAQMQAAQQSMSTADQKMEGEAAEGAPSLASDEVEWQSGGSEQTQPPQDPRGGPTGHASGDPVGGEGVLGDPTRLEVELEVEVLEADKGLEEEPEQENIFHEESRQQRSTLEYQNVRQLSRYAEASAMHAERIPWRYRNLVKLYFLAIRPREDDGNGNR